MRRHATTPGHVRSGTTLVEVLMSLLIMGIGLVSVATLFPLSVLRSVEATQMTTATTLRYTAEALIDSSWTDPIYDPPGTTTIAFSTRLGVPAATVQLIGCSRAAIVLDPDGDHSPLVNDTNLDAGGNSIYVDSDHVEGYYVVDPIGYWRLRQQGATHDQARHFGDWSGVGGPIVAGGGTVYNINRFSLNQTDPTDTYNLFGFTGDFTEVDENADLAAARVSSPDSYASVADGFPQGANITASSVRFDSSEADFSAFLIGGMPDWIGLARGQVTVYSRDGRRSVVRQIDTTYSDPPANTTRSWTNATSDLSNQTLQFVPPLPTWLFDAGAGVNNVGRVTVETADDRYSWMLMVRNQNYKGLRRALVDVVTFHRRAFGAADERIYAVARNLSTSPTLNRRKQQLREYFVTWTPGTDPRPEVDEGEWMFDPLGFRWHKIGQVVTEEADPNIAGNQRIVFRLEASAATSDDISRGMFMQGIVDVYPIEAKSSD